MNISANALSPFRIAIKLIRIFALSELSSHLKNTQLLANGSVEYAQWGEKCWQENGKCLPPKRTADRRPKCVRQHSCGGACYII